MDPAFKAAQKGEKAAERQLEGLMEGLKLGPKDTILFLDLLPHAGDRAKAVRNLQKKDPTGTKGKWMYMGCATGLARDRLDFPKKRVAIDLAKDWLNAGIDFFKTDAQGNLTKVRPNRVVPDPTDEMLTRITGAKAAWDGASKLTWQALQLQGSRLILDPKYEAEFSAAPNCVAEEFRQLKAMHEKHWANAMVEFLDPARRATSMAQVNPGTPEGEQSPNAVDPRPSTSPESTVELVEFESKKALEETTKLTITVKSAHRGVELLRDELHNSYLCSATNQVIPAGTIIGGFGGGNWVASDPAFKSAVSWVLPKGDKTMVSLDKARASAVKKEKDAEKAEPTERAERTQEGTLYAILRDLEKAGHQDIKLTVFGLARATGEPGRHGYTFDAKVQAGMDYVLKGDGEATRYNQSNAFCPGSTKDLYAGRTSKFNNYANNNNINNK